THSLIRRSPVLNRSQPRKTTHCNRAWWRVVVTPAYPPQNRVGSPAPHKPQRCVIVPEHQQFPLPPDGFSHVNRHSDYGSALVTTCCDPDRPRQSADSSVTPQRS